MKTKGLVAGVAVFVMGSCLVCRVQADANFHLQHEDGRIGVWQLDGLRLKTSLVYDPPQASDGHQLRGVHDFDRDGDGDLFFESGKQHVQVWLLDSESRVATRGLGTLAKDEHLIWVGEWNASQGTDLLTLDANRLINLRHWNEREGLSAPRPIISVGTSDQFVTCADVDGDGASDLLISDPIGRIEAWLLRDGPKIKETIEWEFDSQFLNDWQIVGAAELDENPGIDVVLQQRDGRFAVWPLVFPDFLDVIDLSEAPDDAGWRVAAVESTVEASRHDTSASSDSPSPTAGPLNTSPLPSFESVSFGDPDAETSQVVNQWWHQNGTPFLEIWVP